MTNQIYMIYKNEESIDKWLEKKERENCNFIKTCIDLEIENLNEQNNKLISKII